MNRNRRKEQAFGFTLIELLVVVSIIALLVSILMPALAKAREMAKRAVCSANLHSIGNVAHQYASDNKDFLWLQATNKNNGPDFLADDPTTWHNDNRPRPNVAPYFIRVSNRELLRKSYGMSDELWVCPSYLSQNPGLLSKTGTLVPVNIADISPEDPVEELYKYYKWNNLPFWPPTYVLGYFNLVDMRDLYLTYPPEGYVEKSPRRMSEKGDRYLFSDVTMVWVDYDWGNPYTWIAHRSKGKTSPPAGGNLCLLDGHVEWRHPSIMARYDRDIFDPDAEARFRHVKADLRYYYW